MVILNGLINLILRLPEYSELSGNYGPLFLNLNLDFMFLGLYGGNYDIVDLATFTFILTFSTNVFIFFMFNKKFRIAFRS